MSDEPGEELVAGIARGDARAFERFYDRYVGLAFGLIRRIVGERAAAQNVLQEVFWQGWKDAASCDRRRGAVEAWLVMRAKTRAIDRLRAQRRAPGGAPLDEATAGDPTPAADVAAALESRGLVEGLLGRLP